MLVARFTDGTYLKKLVEALKDFKEINLECDENGITSKVMDECHVSLADLRLSPSVFEFYTCDTPCVIGLNLDTLNKVTRSAPNDKALSLTKKSDADRLRIESDEDSTGLKRAADIALISVTGDTLTLPDEKYQVDIEMPTKLYAQMIRDLSAIGEDVSITVNAKAIKFEADGDSGRVENTFHRGQGAFVSTLWNCEDILEGSVSQAFAIRFLTGFSKACPLSESVMISLSAGNPLKLQFPLGDQSSLTFYVAPALE